MIKERLNVVLMLIVFVISIYVTNIIVNVAELNSSTDEAVVIDLGTCTDTISWEITGSEEELTLTLKGSGGVPDYSLEELKPWEKYKKSIKYVDLETGITHLGNYTFYNCENLKSIWIPASIKSIASTAFENSALKEVYFDGTQEEWTGLLDSSSAFAKGTTICFSNGTTITIPAGRAVADNYTDEKLNIGDYILFGKYNGVPILWRCVNIDANGPLLLSDKILTMKPFDAAGTNGNSSHIRGNSSTHKRTRRGSGYWADSNIRTWLNSTDEAGLVTYPCGNPPTNNAVYNGYDDYASERGFLSADNFTGKEIRMIKEVTQKFVLNKVDVSLADGGIEEHREGLEINNFLLNYDSAYYQNTTDKMFLINLEQLDAVYNNLGDYYMGYPTPQAVEKSERNLSVDKKYFYWLRDSMYNDYVSTHARVVGGEPKYTGRELDFVWSYDDVGVGVRPAFYLDTQLFSVDEGNGSFTNPYYMKIESIPTVSACGDNLTWNLSADGVLTISGTGNMYNFEEQNPPWFDKKEQIYAIVIEEEVTSIGSNSFAGCSNISSAEIAKSVVNIYDNAFEGVSNLEHVEYIGLFSDWLEIRMQPGNDNLMSGYDSDKDYIPDEWERNGVDYDHDGIIDLPLNEMGADPSKKDIFVEIDWMIRPQITIGSFVYKKETNLGPTQYQLLLVCEAFERQGINLHLDAGPESYDFVTGEKWGKYSRGNEIEYTKIYAFPVTYSLNDQIKKEFGRYPDNLCESKEISMEDTIFKYCIFGNYYRYENEDTYDTSSGVAHLGLIKAPVLFVANQDWVREGQGYGGNLSVAGTFMHELGHTLGLDHGGDEGANYKPNYISVMNYSFQNIGIIGRNVVDYSGVKLPTINKTSLHEEHGIDNKPGEGPYLKNGEGTIIYKKSKNKLKNRVIIENVAGKAIDFNQNGIIDAETTVNVPTINFDDKTTELRGFNDWEYIPKYSDVNNVYYNAGSVQNEIKITQEEKTLEMALESNSLALDNSGYLEVVGPYTLVSNAENQKIYIDIFNSNNILNEYILTIETSNITDEAIYRFSVEGSIEKLEFNRIAVPVKDKLKDGKYNFKCILECGGKTLCEKTIDVEVFTPTDDEKQEFLRIQEEQGLVDDISMQYREILFEDETLFYDKVENNSHNFSKIEKENEKGQPEQSIAVATGDKNCILPWVLLFLLSGGIFTKKYILNVCTLSK